jgi:hypothetical protein
VGALALGVSALAAPRPVDDSAVRGTNKGKTEVTRLVTGDPAQIEAVVAGAPGGNAIIEIVPVQPPAGNDCNKANANGDPNTICATGSNAGNPCPGGNADCPPSPAYPAGTTIVGNTLTTESSEGFRVWLEVHISNWDPSGDGVVQGSCVLAGNGVCTALACAAGAGFPRTCPGGANSECDGCSVGTTGAACTTDNGCDTNLKVYQVKQDCIGDGLTKGYMNSKGTPLANPVIPCTVDEVGDAMCQAEFGQNWTKCEGTPPTCKPGFLDSGGTKHAPNNWCAGPNCSAGDVATGINCNYNFFGVHSSATGKKDNHIVYYAGTEVIDVPGKDPGPPAKGRYCVNLILAETFLADTQAPPADIAVAQKNGFCIDIQQGSCCHNLGDPVAGGCIDDVLHNECDAPALQPSLWKAEKDGGFCANPPTADGCAQCTLNGRNTDPLCDDDDSCTDDDCAFPPGLCSHKAIAGWDQGTECCEGGAALPVITTLDDGDVCTLDKCVNSAPNPPSPPAMETGTARNNPAVGPCDDGNPCTTPDLCDGINTGEAACSGTNVNDLPCQADADCPLTTDPLDDPAAHYTCGTETFKKCFCTLIPNVQFVLSPSVPKTCVGGFRDDLPCATDADCTGGGVCNNFADGANCFDQGEKITAVVKIGSAGGPINGGELLMTYDPTCVSYVSATCLSPYVTTVYGPVVNAAAGTIFIACGVDPFAGINGPAGNVNMVSLSFTKNGACDNCELCFADANPQHSYLVDDEGQAVNIEGKCKELSGKGDLELNIPDNIKTNVDCDKPTAALTWDSPTATFSCGDVNLSCRGAHENGTPLPGLVMGGGVFPQGASSFCCYALAKDKCGQSVGCPGSAHDCGQQLGKPEGCWTVQVNDETSMDIDIGLEPPTTTTNRDGTLTRCIEFCLYANCVEAPLCFQDFVTFGGIFNFVGKSQGKIKIPGKGQWDCITAQDQLHSLRSCCRADENPPCLFCDGSQLVADFTGDPELGGNWLIGGNLDAFKKDVPKASTNIIDILDFGMYVSQYGVCYADKSPDCHDGPHADINGDGCVTVADYMFLVRNFMLSSKDCCCVGDGAAAPTPLAEVSVDELRQMGMGELVVADLNGDGLVNAQDMDAFTQGARPTKTSNDRKGGKGLRSGR